MREDRNTNTTKGRPGLSRIETPQTKLNSFVIDSKGSLIRCDEETALAKLREEPCWIDVTVYSTRDVAELQSDIVDKMELSPFLRRHLRQPQQLQTSQVLTLSKASLIVVRILPFEENSKEIRYAVALCLEGLLLTVTICPEKAELIKAERVLSQKTLNFMQERELPQASITGALSVWLMCHANRVAEVLNNLRKRIFDLSEVMETNVASVDMAQISNVKDELLRVLAVAEEQLQCVQSLAEGETTTSSIDFSNLKGTLGVLLSTAGSTERMALRLEKRVHDLRQMYDAHQQDRVNHRLAVLTIFSAVFLPITLMAGIWGMNFVNIPELERQNGYYFALAAMFTVAIVMLSTFYFFGWFT